jgi:tetratricopeptide (TPR) repeat protein
MGTEVRSTLFLVCPGFSQRCAAGIAVLLVAALLPGSQVANRPQVDSAARVHLRAGQQALEKHNLREAKAQLESALKADPNLAEAHLALGMVEFQAGDNARAIDHYRRAIALQPNAFSAHYNLALAYLRDKDLSHGLHELERAAALNPRSADAAYNLGLVLLELGRPAEALAWLRRATALGPDRPDLAFNRVRAELAAHETEAARREAESAAKAFGNDAEWRLAVGSLFLERGQPTDATTHLAEAFRLQPDSSEVRRKLATAQLEAHDPEGAITVLVSPTSAEDHYVLGSAHFLLRHLAEADQESRRAVEQEPLEPRYLLLRARIEQRLGEHATALEMLRRVSELAPTWSEPHYSAGVSYYLQRRYAEARSSLEKALELDPRSTRALFLYAATLVNEGKNREGEEYMRRAITLEPSNARFQYHLGALLLRDNRPLEARQALDRSIQLKPDFAPPHYQLGKLLARVGQPELAARELETAVRHQPNLAEAYYQLSQVYASIGKEEESRHALATFNQLKKEAADEGAEFAEEVRKQLEIQ